MFIPDWVQEEADYSKCIAFHGHTCMGVTIGYLAAKLAMELLGVDHSEDEELIVIVENDACCCDAIQVLTGCTFGKGNFFFLDHGKMAFTFGDRVSGKAVRLLLKQEVFAVPEREKILADKAAAGELTVSETQEYTELFEARGERFFSQGPQAFFTIKTMLDFEFPERATRAPSAACEVCGEMVMETKLSFAGGHHLCQGCKGK